MLSKKFFYYFPVNIFIFIWLLVYFLLNGQNTNYFNLNTSSMFVLTSGILAVILGYFMQRFFCYDQKIEIFHKNHLKKYIFNYSLLFKIVILVNLIIAFSIFFYLKIISSEIGGIVRFFENPILSRMYIVGLQNETNWNVLLSISSYGVNLIVLSSIISGVLFTSKERKHWLVSFFLIFLILGYSLTNFSRYSLIAPTCWWIFSIVFSAYFTEPKIQKKIFIRIVGLVVFLFIFLFSVSYLIVVLRNFTSKIDISEIFFHQLSYYFVGNVVSFDQYLINDPNLLYGKGIFRTFIKWFVRLGLFEPHEIVTVHNQDFTKINHRTYMNTFTFLRNLYEDFGVIGMLVQCFLLGFVIAKVVVKFLNQFKFISLYLVCLFTFTLLMSFYSFYLLGITKIIFDLLLFYFFDRLFLDKCFIVKDLKINT